MNDKILIATKEILPAEMFKMLIDNKKLYPSIDIVHDGNKAIEYITEHRPRLILIDLYLPVLSAIAFMEELNKLNLHPKVICICSEINTVLSVKLFKAGVSGIIDNSTPIAEAKKIMQKVATGKVVIPDIIEELIASRDFEINKEKYAPLTMRQTEILHLTGAGFSNVEISNKLNICIKTVEMHKRKIRDKMGLGSSMEIAIYAITHGFVEIKEVACL